jgi:hypothetical protein
LRLCVCVREFNADHLSVAARKKAMQHTLAWIGLLAVYKNNQTANCERRNDTTQLMRNREKQRETERNREKQRETERNRKK